MAAVMSIPAGRRFLWRMLDEATGLFGASYAGEANATLYREGQRSIGIALMTELQRVVPGDYARMIAEALDALQKEQAQRRAEEMDRSAD